MIGHLVLFSWPLVVYLLFTRYHPATALSGAIIGGYLLLPGNIQYNFPGLPTIGKSLVPALSALIVASMVLRPQPGRGREAVTRATGARGTQVTVMPGLIPRSRAVQILLLMTFIGVVGTVATNTDTLRVGTRVLSAMRPYDAGSMVLGTMTTLLPFVLARKYLAEPDGQTRLLVVLAVAGLAYSLPALWEVRMSPQLSRMVYGYFPHDWRQHIRAGGFRPVVFLSHGLWLTAFFCISFLATLSLWRITEGRMRLRWLIGSAWLFGTLVLAKGMGALGIGIMLGAVIIFLPLRLRMFVAAGFAAMMLVYPTLRGADLVPTDAVLSFAHSIDADRASSLRFRIDNEDLLLAKANDRPLFGWGSWGRNRVFAPDGTDLSVTDGYWVMAIGTGGWIGYLSTMGLLTAPLILMALRWRSLGLTPATSGLALALTANLLDLIPNATLTVVTWLIAGALAGRLELGRAAVAQLADGPPQPLRTALRRSRQEGTRDSSDTAADALPGDPADTAPDDPAEATAGDPRALPLAPNPYTRQPHRHRPRREGQ